MQAAQKIRNILRGLLQAYGTRSVKRRLWNVEFQQGRWDCLDRTPGDCVYPYVEKYATNGSILDLGCGSGSTGNELDSTTYQDYAGVDISDVAIEKAKKKSEENFRGSKNRYFQSDFSSYAPTAQYDVILFRDSIYYVPPRKVISMLKRYSNHLKENGVFIVRMWSGSGKCKLIVDTIESNFHVVEKHVSGRPEAVVIVFRQARLFDRNPLGEMTNRANSRQGRSPTVAGERQTAP